MKSLVCLIALFASISASADRMTDPYQSQDPHYYERQSDRMYEAAINADKAARDEYNTSRSIDAQNNDSKRFPYGQ